MKKTLTLLLAMLVIFAGGMQAKDRTLRILAIGNSFSEDAIEQNLWELFNARGQDVIIGNMYIGGCTLERHASNAASDAPAYRYRKITGGKTEEVKNFTLSAALADEPWDYVSLQQASGRSGLYESYSWLPGLIGYVKERTPDDVTIVFHQTWAYSSDSSHPEFVNYGNDQNAMYEAICGAVARAAEDNPDIRLVIPAGPAIQNARATVFGDTFCRDGFHLELTYGRYTAACAWYEAISGKSVKGNPYHPESMTKEQARIIQKAVHKAFRRKK